MSRQFPIIGHKSVVSELEQDIAADNVSHAYLLSGPKHIGKMSIAHFFAEKLLCSGLPEDATDEEKKDCQKHIENLTHSDLLVLDQLWIDGVCDDWDVIARSSNVVQQHRSKAPKAKTDTISIDDIRALQERLHETGTSKYRCCIIRSLERMQDAAANALLKILEEPPEGLVFIFTTEALSQLLPTLISRMRVLRCHRLSRKELLPLLSGLSESEATFILHIAQGAPGIVQALVDDPDVLREHRHVHTAATSFWKEPSLKQKLQLLKPMHKRSQEADQLLLHLALALREHSCSPTHTQALSQYARGLTTNTHRQLLTQQFALSVNAAGVA